MHHDCIQSRSQRIFMTNSRTSKPREKEETVLHLCFLVVLIVIRVIGSGMIMGTSNTRLIIIRYEYVTLIIANILFTLWGGNCWFV